MDSDQIPALIHPLLEIRHGLRIRHFDGCILGADEGGAYLYPSVQPSQQGGTPTLSLTQDAPVFVTVEICPGLLWYGQLILCFVAQYTSKLELCYVRCVIALPCCPPPLEDSPDQTLTYQVAGHHSKRRKPLQARRHCF